MRGGDQRTPIAALEKESKAWEAEVDAIVGDAQLLSRTIESELPPSVALDAELPDLLSRLQDLAGHFRQTKRLIGALLHTYLECIPTPRRESLLAAVTSDRTKRFRRVSWVQPSICGLDLAPAFLARWFLSVLPADGAGTEFWGVIEGFALAKPAAALDVACDPVLIETDVGRSVRVTILGALRYRTGLPSDLVRRLNAILEALSRHLDPLERRDSLRTLKPPLWRGAVPTADVLAAFAYVEKLPAAERLVGFEFAGSLGASDTVALDQKVIALRWLKDHVHATCGLRQKITAVHALWRSWKIIDPATLGFDPIELVVAVQPVDNDDAELWDAIEHVLHEALEAAPDRFRQWLTAIARDHGKAVRKALERQAPLTGLLVGLSHVEWKGEFVSTLMASAHSGERRLGFQLFEALGLAPTSAPAGAVFTPQEFKIWRAEFQIARAYESVAAQLATAARRLDLQSHGMVTAFQEEALYHCKNLPGLCLDKLRPLADELAMLKPVIFAADAYFEKLHGVTKSPLKAQQIPGLARAMFRKVRAERRRLDQMVEKQSILSFLATKSYLLYGSRYSNWMGGKLSGPSDLQATSSSFEIPRLETIDPETTFRRRLNALAFLQELKRRDDGAPQKETEA